ncbi:hypothetical protein Nepgr_017111 [Nepenthes gracilis]|uniref:Uncharacterized protein n=1 Tax=Nepenthes gracilis TaxID=150966 RepID=A0AAD3XT38_NEPGR|nr:hypothetical protein Nepgr_017111 [Nepenthes gracilis]
MPFRLSQTAITAFGLFHNASLYVTGTQGARLWQTSNEAIIRIELVPVPKKLAAACKTICSNYKKNKSAQRWNYHRFYSFHFHPPDVAPGGEPPQNHTLSGSPWRSSPPPPLSLPSNSLW